MRRLTTLLALAAAVALATMLVAWWMVPVVCAAWGIWQRGRHGQALDAGIAAAIGWGLLLALVATRGPAMQVAAQVGGVVGVPASVLVLLTLLFPFVLGWSSARVAGAIPRGARHAAEREPRPGNAPAPRLTSAEAGRLAGD